MAVSNDKNSLSLTYRNSETRAAQQSLWEEAGLEGQATTEKAMSPENGGRWENTWQI